jgi:hypothetical protein
MVRPITKPSNLSRADNYASIIRATTLNIPIIAAQTLGAIPFIVGYIIAHMFVEVAKLLNVSPCCGFHDVQSFMLRTYITKISEIYI